MLSRLPLSPDRSWSQNSVDGDETLVFQLIHILCFGGDVSPLWGDMMAVGDLLSLVSLNHAVLSLILPLVKERHLVAAPR
jgi:hypothetical protein